MLDLFLNSSGAIVGVGLALVAGTEPVKTYFRFLHGKGSNR
jgi:hypothetical protein